MRNASLLALALAATAFVPACSSTPYKQQEYAKLSNSKDFEYDFNQVWQGVIDALGDYKIEKKDTEAGKIVTDWIYSTSNDKYLEYQVDGFPRKKYLQTRYKFDINVERKIGKVTVVVNPEEEIENLKSDGSFDSWKSVSDFDTGRANEMLKNIEMKILSRPDALNK